MDQRKQIIRVFRWLAILPIALFVNGWLYFALVSVLIILLMPFESIITSYSMFGKVVNSATIFIISIVDAIAAFCAAYAIAPKYKFEASLLALAVICLYSAATLLSLRNSLGIGLATPEYVHHLVLTLVAQIFVFCFIATVLRPQIINKQLLRLASNADAQFEYKWIAIQIVLCFIGCSIEVIDFTPAAQKVFIPISAISSAGVLIIFSKCRDKLSKRMESFSFAVSLVSMLQLALICSMLFTIMSYHPEENIARSKEFEAKLNKKIYDGVPDAYASSATLAAIAKYEHLYNYSQTVKEILEIGRLGGTIGEIPARRRVRAILKKEKDPVEIVAAAKVMHEIVQAESNYSKDSVLWQLAWDAQWECVRRAAEFKGLVGADMVTAIRPDVAGSDTANGRVFDNYECRQKGQAPKWSKDETTMPDDDL